MKKISICILTAFFISLLSGCFVLPRKSDKISSTSKTLLTKSTFKEKNILSKEYQIKSLELKKNGELQKAIIYMKAANVLKPDDSDIEAWINSLQANIDEEAEKHFKRGLVYFKQNLLEKAHKELLITLRYNPYHKKAFYFLKNELIKKKHISYKIKEKDTFKKIAEKIYKDPDKDFLIAYFMGISVTSKPKPGKIIQLPVLDPKATRKPVDVTAELNKAKALFKNKNYIEALPVAIKILRNDKENKEAYHLVNASYYQLGKELAVQKKYQESLKMLCKTDPAYKDVKTIIAGLKKFLKKRAESHYKRGVEYFVNDKLKAAIKEWKKTLALDPDNKDAKKDIENAKSLLEKLKKVE